MTLSATQQLNRALDALRNAEMIILSDHPGRENEGDIVVAAECVNTEQMAFIMREAKGTICVAMDEANRARFEIPMCPRQNAMVLQAPFGLCVDAAEGISTGICAADRARTMNVLANPDCGPADIQYPGHVFTLRAEADGLSARQGHTEAAVELMKQANLQPACVICEICNDDGSAARPDDLAAFAHKHQLQYITMEVLLEALNIAPFEEYNA